MYLYIYIVMYVYVYITIYIYIYLSIYLYNTHVYTCMYIYIIYIYSDVKLVCVCVETTAKKEKKQCLTNIIFFNIQMLKNILSRITFSKNSYIWVCSKTFLRLYSNENCKNCI